MLKPPCSQKKLLENSATISVAFLRETQDRLKPRRQGSRIVGKPSIGSLKLELTLFCSTILFAALNFFSWAKVLSVMLTNFALLHCKCCHLLISLVFWAALIPMSSAFPLSNSSPLYQFDGQVRLRHLYTADDHTQLHLEIMSDGAVRGSRYQNPFSLMEIKAVKPGIIRMQAKKTERFLCMKPSGHLYGSLFYSEEACNFREIVLRDGYNLYYSEKYNIPVSLSLTGTLAHNRQLPPFSQFLPLVNKIPLEPVFVDYDYYEQTLDVESSDPMSMMGPQPGVISPSYIF